MFFSVDGFYVFRFLGFCSYYRNCEFLLAFIFSVVEEKKWKSVRRVVRKECGEKRMPGCVFMKATTHQALIRKVGSLENEFLGWKQIQKSRFVYIAIHHCKIFSNKLLSHLLNDNAM